MKIRVNIKRADNGWYVVYCPNLVGKCFGQDTDKDKAIEHFKMALNDYLLQEGPDPAGQSYDSVEIEA
jgi:hypothetical protein